MVYGLSSSRVMLRGKESLFLAVLFQKTGLTCLSKIGDKCHVALVTAISSSDGEAESPHACSFHLTFQPFDLIPTFTWRRAPTRNSPVIPQPSKL